MERGDVPTAVRRQRLRGKQARPQALPTTAMEAETLAGEGFVRGADGLVPLATDARRQHVHYTHVRTHSPSDVRRLWALGVIRRASACRPLEQTIIINMTIVVITLGTPHGRHASPTSSASDFRSLRTYDTSNLGVCVRATSVI